MKLFTDKQAQAVLVILNMWLPSYRLVILVERSNNTIYAWPKSVKQFNMHNVLSAINSLDELTWFLENTQEESVTKFILSVVTPSLTGE